MAMRWSARCSRPSRSRRASPRCCCPSTSRRSRPSSCAGCARVYTPVLHWSLAIARSWSPSGMVFLGRLTGLLGSRLGSEFLPALEEGNLWIRASMPPTISLEAGMPIVNRIREILLQPSRSHHGGVAARPARQRQRRGRLLQCRVLRAAQAVRRMADRHDQGQADRRAADRNSTTSSPASTSTSRNTSRTTSRKACRASKAPIRPRSSAPISASSEKLAAPGHARDGAGQGHHRSRHFLGARPAQPQHHGRPRQGGALRPQRRRRQYRRAGGARRHGGDHAAGGRPPVQRRGAAGAGIPRQHRRDRATSRSATRPPATATPISR